MPQISEDQMKEAHVKSHRVGHSVNRLTPPEQEIYDEMISSGKTELRVGSMVAGVVKFEKRLWR